ncbi:anthrone oxygenase family protein [Micromonospora sp. CPCC 206060]|uniref:anthrone oxygenase family protein n=1 Tax=Micromonospora sp. CPCC 206060 TaxID=3122406 RepID=UPI002FF2925E
MLTIALLAATVTTGLMAGLFAGFAFAVMPGLRRAGDRTFVDAMQQINRAILNGWFLGCFLGAPVTLGAATLLSWLGDEHRVLPFVGAALLFYLVVFGVTAAVNVPLNNRLDQAGPPDLVRDVTAVRRAFESRWVTWNVVRAGAATAGLGCLAWALVRHAA